MSAAANTFSTFSLTLSLLPSCVVWAVSVSTHSLLRGPAVEGRHSAHTCKHNNSRGSGLLGFTMTEH